MQPSRGWGILRATAMGDQHLRPYETIHATLSTAFSSVSDDTPADEIKLSGLQSVWLMRALLLEPLEVFSGLLAFTIGAWWLLLSPHAFQSASSYYRVMSSLMPQWAWGLVMLSLGSYKWTALFASQATIGRDRTAWYHRRSASFVTSIVWAFFSAMFMMSDWRSTGTALWMLFAIMDAVSYIRLGMVPPDAHGGV